MSDSKVNKHSETRQNIIQNDTKSYTVENIESTETDKSIPVPTELLAEFLSSVMTKDYENALNYCTQILNHEPNNSTALEFYPLIVEKLEMKLEDSSSESSETRSSTSSSSENSLFRNEALKWISSTETSKSHSSSERDKINDSENWKFTDFSGSNIIPLERKFTSGNAEIIKPNTSYLREESNVKTSTKKQIKMKKTHNNAHSPSNLIHSKEKKLLNGDNMLKLEVKTIKKPKQVNQKAQKKSNISRKSSEVLLHMTKTKTFSKGPPTSTDEEFSAKSSNY